MAREPGTVCVCIVCVRASYCSFCCVCARVGVHELVCLRASGVCVCVSDDLS